MKLYYMPGVCSLAAHIVLEWIGEPYQIEEVPRAELRSPAYRKLNPDGVVPVLVDDDGWVLTENIAILNYLADRFPAARLGGDGTPRGRAEINRWLGLLNSDVHPAFKPLFRPERFIAEPAQHPLLQDAARAKLRGYFEQLNAQLAGHDWLAGARSIADPYLFVVQRWARAKAVDLGGLDQLERLVHRMHADPGVKAAMHAEGI